MASLMVLPPGCAPEALDDGFDAARNGSLVDGGAIEGRYEKRIATLLDGGSRISHHVKTDDGVYELLIDEVPEDLAYDSWVRVPGEALPEAPTGARWQADELQLVAPPPQPIIDATPRDPRRIGTVLVFWDQMGLNNGNATNSMYTDNESTNVYYGEISYGIETMSGKVFGPYQIDMPNGCNTDLIVQRADAAMIDKGHDPTQFTQMMYHFPGGLGCSFAGLASVGSPDFPARNSWYANAFGCNVRNQELGHNYGMGHSHAYSCPAVPMGMDHNLYEDCSHVEYGHPYDPMGNGCGHMNVVQKTYMGWLQECNVVTATSDGVFNLMATELPCNGTQALRFPAYDGRLYYLEYRNGDGPFDNSQPGVLVNIAYEIGGFGPPNYVLDELGQDQNGYLREGDSFTDPGGSGTFTVLALHDTYAEIQITLPGGGDGLPPTCRDGGEPLLDGSNIGSLECAAIPYPGDDTAPVVDLTYPMDGQWFEPGSDFTITAEASDDRFVAEVTLYLGSDPYDTRIDPPWEWDATNIPAGDYVFGVVALDARNNQGVSQAVTIHVGTPSADSTGADETAGSDDAMGTTGLAPGDTGDEDDESSGTTLPQGGELDDGCGCRQRDGGRGGLGFGLMVLGLVALRRRRLRA
ncbi:Ig-like domain-containing protein [Paraliomyxa miuraensis]|uniref:Ig-like domain-containing protein n=1 Tax=Paraliomyxa miuraensis TaxID=376150 RepID=UPI00224E9104|nr:Ig-like domain-containing protein [Paraliomyxa miuraensis]MCX4243171.1 Ig-like domain-containing protein [Paraliomyxa miuraensis]